MPHPGFGYVYNTDCIHTYPRVNDIVIFKMGNFFVQESIA